MCIKIKRNNTCRGRLRRHTSSYIYIYIKDKYNVCKHGHKTGVQEQGGKHSP